MTGADSSEESSHETVEGYKFTLKDRVWMAVGWLIIGSIVTAVVTSSLWAMPLPVSDAAAEFFLLLGAVSTLGLIMAAFFAPGKEVEPDAA